MSILASKFNVRRGWPNGSTIDETFLPSSGVTPVLDEGDFVAVQTDGTVNRASSQDLAGAGSVGALAALLASPVKFWMIVSGNNPAQYDGLRQGWVSGDLGYKADKVVAINGKFQVTTEKYVVRSYVPGDQLCVVDGKLDIINGSTNTGLVCVGEVYAYDATKAILTATISI